jgi:hypothetical protein
MAARKASAPTVVSVGPKPKDARRRSRASLVSDALSSIGSSNSDEPAKEPEPVHVVTDPRRKSRGGLVFAALSHHPAKEQSPSVEKIGAQVSPQRVSVNSVTKPSGNAYDPNLAKKGAGTVAQTKQPSLSAKLRSAWSTLTACFSSRLSSRPQGDSTGHVTEVAVQQAKPHCDGDTGSEWEAPKLAQPATECLKEVS